MDYLACVRAALFSALSGACAAFSDKDAFLITFAAKSAYSLRASASPVCKSY
jgi:hypothetical protein